MVHPDIAIIRYPGNCLEMAAAGVFFVPGMGTRMVRKFATSDRTKGAVSWYIVS